MSHQATAALSRTLRGHVGLGTFRLEKARAERAAAQRSSEVPQQGDATSVVRTAHIAENPKPNATASEFFLYAFAIVPVIAYAFLRDKLTSCPGMPPSGALCSARRCSSHRTKY